VPCKTAKLIEIPFGWLTQMGPRNHNALDRVEISYGKGQFLGVEGPDEKHW